MQQELAGIFYDSECMGTIGEDITSTTIAGLKVPSYPPYLA